MRVEMRRIIVDTSVWIDYLKGNLSEFDKKNLVSLITLRQIVITDIVHNEILIGTKNEGDYKKLNNNFSNFPILRINDEELVDFNNFTFKLKKGGFQCTYTDASIAFISQREKYPVYSFDKYFHKLMDKCIIPKLSFTTH